MKKFTVEDAIKIQNKHLAIWKSKLNSVTYNKLEKECLRTNKLADSGYNVMRGDSLCIYILNMDLK